VKEIEHFENLGVNGSKILNNVSQTNKTELRPLRPGEGRMLCCCATVDDWVILIARNFLIR